MSERTSDPMELRTLRLMAIERAIGEVRAALQTFWKDQELYPGQYVRLEQALKLLEDSR